MAGNLAGYNANDYEPAGEFQPIPEGEYRACITESAFESTKKGDGNFLKLTVQVIDGPFTGRTVFDRLNLDNPSDQAVQIAKAQLSAICRAVGKMSPEDSADLHNIPFMVKLGVRPHDGKVYNEVKSYKAVGGNGDTQKVDAASGQKSIPVGAGASGSRKAAPWAKK